MTWDTSVSDWSTPGSVTIPGSGTDLFVAAFQAIATVEVGGFAGTDPVSLTTYAGVAAATVQAAAPTTVPSRIGSSENRFRYTVVFTNAAGSTTSAPITVTVAR